MTMRSTDLPKAQGLIERRKEVLCFLHALRGPTAAWLPGCANITVESAGYKVALHERASAALFDALCAALQSEARTCEDALAALGVVVVDNP